MRYFWINLWKKNLFIRIHQKVLALTILIFSIIFKLVRPFDAWPLFAGFIGVQMATFAGLLMQDKEV